VLRCALRGSSSSSSVCRLAANCLQPVQACLSLRQGV
jgi:hypothetical protein